MEKSTAWRKVAGGLLAVCWILLLVATMLTALAGCGAGRNAQGAQEDAAAVQQDTALAAQDEDAAAAQTEDAAGSGAEAPEEQAPQAEIDDETATREGGVVFVGDTVTLTLSAETLETLGGGWEDFSGAGFTSVEATDGGGVALTMTADDYAEMMAEMREGIAEAIAGIAVDGESYPSVEQVEADESFTHFTLTVQREAYENGMESLVEVLLGLYSMVYQVYSGHEYVPPVFTLVDTATGEEYDSFSLAA